MRLRVRVRVYTFACVHVRAMLHTWKRWRRFINEPPSQWVGLELRIALFAPKAGTLKAGTLAHYAGVRSAGGVTAARGAMTFDALGSRGFAFTQTDKLLCCKTLANQADTDTCVRVCIDLIYARAMSFAAAPSPIHTVEEKLKRG